MSIENLFLRLARRATGQASMVEPRLAPRFAAGPALPEDPEATAAAPAHLPQPTETQGEARTLPAVFAEAEKQETR